jgi:hypothetical protein
MIYDLAVNAREEKEIAQLEETKNYILAILCSDDHAVTSYEQEEAEGSVFAESYNRVMHGTSIKEISHDLGEGQSTSPSKRSPQSSHKTAQFPSPPHHEFSAMTDSKLSVSHDNKIVEMIRDELGMDHFYMSDRLIILVIINAETIDNTVLVEW